MFMFYTNLIEQPHNLFQVVEIISGKYKGQKAIIENIHIGLLKFGKTYSYSLKLLNEGKTIDYLFTNNEISKNYQ